MFPNSSRLIAAAAMLLPLLALLTACASGPQTGSAPVQFSGDRLVNKAGMTLYTYDKDPAGKSACSGQCAAAWPPLLATASDQAGGDFSIIARDDGARQWAYDGKPLYTWVKDQKPGDRTGDNLNKVWHAAGKAPDIEQPGGGY